ncbi:MULTISPECIES: T9SS type A sorting domain-containing protein [unclassified Chryseobacterium]|uniref:T9SS type A sorting domain-containing protein n=1 Tax=unclassified Chryseobacterium TaxID=2593645 RepID=UPI000F457BD0|nr:T9SS type A sorting domain-containing protein [Chryseobacterium sp. G0240]ROI04600.1 T9SS C-terminal target domain-containing protein [Chryseobacterium sp. G0240]
MKTKLLLASVLALSVQQTVFAQTDALGYTQVNMTMGNNYQNRVFVNLADANMTSQPANSWDIAFYRNSNYEFGSRVNDALDIEVYTAATDLAEWDNINLNNIDSWGEPLYNPDQTTDLSQGAFEQGPITSSNPNQPATGWGLYNGVTHVIEGKAIFVLKYANGTYYKFAIVSAYGGYTFKYSKWNGSAWGPTETKTLANGTDDAFFNYFSFTTGAKVPALEPSRSAWDLMFTKYYTFYNNIMMYPLSGAIQSPNVKVAMVQPETQATSTYSMPADTSFSSNITTVGHSWKGIGTVKSDVVYYIKKGSDYYRMYFITNGGATTGDMYFKYKNITQTLGIKEVGKKASFGVYPNPTTADKKVTVLFDIKERANNKGNVEVYDLTGKVVYSAELTNQAGFYKQDINLSHLTSGNYLVKITYGGNTETKKLIVK